MFATDSYIAGQVETMVVFWAVLVGVILWGFFQRNPSE
jgi:hypothetical protein